MKMNMILYTLEKSWWQKFWEKFVEQVKDLWGDFVDVGIIIKEHTYDLMAKQFGDTVTSFFFITVFFVIVMLIALKIINK
jgi:hypothetical protein